MATTAASMVVPTVDLKLSSELLKLLQEKLKLSAAEACKGIDKTHYLPNSRREIDPSKMTFLSCAIYYEHPRCVQELLAYPFDFLALDSQLWDRDNTSWRLAIRAKDPTILALMLKMKKSDFPRDSRNCRDEDLFDEACRIGNVGAVAQLIEQVLGNKAIKFEHYWQACDRGNHAFVAFLLNNHFVDGFHSQTDEIYKRTAFHMACAKGHQTIVQDFISRGIAQQIRNIGNTDYQPYPIVSAACGNDHYSIAKLLLTHNILPEKDRQKILDAALDEASSEGHYNYAMIDLLRTYGANTCFISVPPLVYFSRMYKKLFRFISRELVCAELEKKYLVVLLGEHHRELESLIVIAMIADIAKKLHIREFSHEINTAKSDLEKDGARGDYRCNLIQHLGHRHTENDLYRTDPTKAAMYLPNYQTMDKWVARNYLMSCAFREKSAHQVAIVGRSHLKPLIEENSSSLVENDRQRVCAIDCRRVYPSLTLSEFCAATLCKTTSLMLPISYSYKSIPHEMALFLVSHILHNPQIYSKQLFSQVTNVYKRSGKETCCPEEALEVYQSALQRFDAEKAPAFSQKIQTGLNEIRHIRVRIDAARTLDRQRILGWSANFASSHGTMNEGSLNSGGFGLINTHPHTHEHAKLPGGINTRDPKKKNSTK